MVPKIFEYNAEEFGLKIGVKYDLDLPLDEYTSFEEIFGHFVCKTRLLEPFHRGARKALQSFIRTETQRHYDQIAEDAVTELLDSEKDLDTVHFYSVLNNRQSSTEIVNEIPQFNADFQYVIENFSNEQLMRLVCIEQDMSREMRELIKARDFDLERLRKACEDTVEKTSEMTNQIDEHAYNLSILNEKLRKCNDNYYHQRQAMIERHKNEFAEILRRLKQDGSIPIERLNRFSSTQNIQHSSSRHSFKQENLPLEESFTIYIGAQLKTMHNARIVQFDKLINVCHSSARDLQEDVYNSRRLQSLMSLYGRDLSAGVLIVGRDPLYHMHSNTDLFRLCERSAELHFDTLSDQLNKINLLVRSTNKSRKSLSPNQQLFDYVEESDDESLLRPGDIYVTCHSNLSSVQVIFHLVGEKTLETTDINSRHPCINGLRNCVRLAARNAINTLSFPLFLVEEMKPNMTIQWCINRAELVFKCMKGFLMEICSSGAGSTANVPTSSKPVHYNMNFVVPQMNKDVFESVTEMFPNIFHLVPTVGQ